MKLPFDNWKNSMSFMIDDEFDNSFLRTIEPLATLMTNSTNQFRDPISLGQFLTSNENNIDPHTRLKAFISLIGLSEERLKRVVSLVRYQFYNEEFRSEWAVKKISKTILADENFKNLLTNFFVNGRNSEIGQEIPLYYMKNFRLLSDEFIADLTQFRYVERILNDNEIQGRYSNDVGAHVERTIEKRLIRYKREVNGLLLFQTQQELPLLNKNVDFLIPGVENPSILIESSYNITTGSAQSKRADQMVELYGIIMRHNANHPNSRIILVNYCDGFGWVGRQRDLRRIYDASDYVLNRKNIDLIDDILNMHY